MLGLHASCLPFPRGSTANADGFLTLGDTGLSDYEGKVYEVPDDVHNTGVPILLMCVKNDTGGAITAARKFCKFSAATALDHGRRIGTFPNDVDSGLAVPLDDAYTVGYSIADDDLFYVLIKGWCNIATQGVGNFAAHMGVSSSALGVIRDLAAVVAGEFVAGTLAYAASYSANSTAVVNVDCTDLNLSPAAG